jgi:hypothetical protein
MMFNTQGGRKSLGWSSIVNHNVECLAREVTFQKSKQNIENIFKRKQSLVI